MAWIESHQSLARHPKLLRLARLLKVNKAQAIGHLHLFWWWTLDYSPTGELSAFTSCELGAAAEWQGDGGQFVKALVESGWADHDGNGLHVHDWHDYAGKLVKEREIAKERMKALRARSPNISARSPNVLTTQQYPTVPNPTEPIKEDIGASQLLLSSPVAPTDKSGEKMPVSHSDLRDESKPDGKACGESASQQGVEPTEKQEAKPVVKRFIRPTLPEIILHCHKIGLPESEAARFQAHHETNEWFRGKTPIRNWHAALTTWKLNYESNRFGSRPAGSPRLNPAVERDNAQGLNRERPTPATVDEASVPY